MTLISRMFGQIFLSQAVIKYQLHNLKYIIKMIDFILEEFTVVNDLV